MKNLQKFILPLLFLIVIYFIYTIYFAPKNELGAFSNFDTNNNANKDIKVMISQNKEIKNDMQSGGSSFYAMDKDGKEELVEGPIIPTNINKAMPVMLKGHLHEDHFHAVEINQ